MLRSPVALVGLVVACLSLLGCPPPGPEPCPFGFVPREVSASTVVGGVLVDWEDRNTQMTYRVQRAGVGDFETLGETDTPPFLDESAERDTRYTYRIQAYRDEECQDVADPVPVAYGPPNPPTNLSIELFDFVGFWLRWEDTNVFETEYVILEAEGTDPDPSDYQEVVRRGPGSVWEAYGGHRYDTWYSVVVGARNPTTEDEVRSEPVIFLTAPAPPEALRFTALSPTSGRLEWRQVSDDATEVVIRRRLTSGFFYEEHARLPATAEAFDDVLEAGEYYDYRVYVVNPSGDGPYQEVTGAGFIPPLITWSTPPTVDATCLLEARGLVDYDDVNGAVFASATAELDGEPAVGQHNRLEADLGGPRLGVVSTTWTVTDTLGGEGTASRDLELFLEPGGDTLARGSPMASAGSDAAPGRQPLLPAEPDLGGDCGRTCLGTRASLALGAQFSCSLGEGGVPACWGAGADGRTGAGDTGDVALPGAVCADAACTTTLGPARQLAAAAGQACAVLDDGGLRCWGAGQVGQLGDGESASRSYAGPVCTAGTLGDGCQAGAAELGGVVQVAMGAQHGCALTDEGRVWCWGADLTGQLGDGQEGPPSPVAQKVCVEGMAPACTTELGGVVQIAAGDLHTCALTDEGRLWCWGRNEDGQLGDGAGGPGAFSTLPVPVGCGAADGARCDAGALASVVQVAAGFAHTCALTDDGAVWCWGLGSRGELGDGAGISSPGPVAALGIEGAVALSLAGEQSCALLDDGGVRCWGEAFDTTWELAPVALCEGGFAASCGAGDDPVVALAVSVGPTHLCAVGPGSMVCLGSDDGGELGRGAMGSDGSTPAAVCQSGVGCTASSGSFSAGYRRCAAVGVRVAN